MDHLKKLHLVPSRVAPDEDLDASEVPSKQTYDCIVIDCNETAQQLRESERYKYTPLVMLTPNISVSFKNALEDGISSYMTTPCNAIDLGNALIPALEGRAAPPVSKNSKSLNILLAEDNAVNQRLAVKILEKYNHKVKVANNGLEAFELVKVNRYDVILMDVQMPIMVSVSQEQLITGCNKLTLSTGWFRSYSQHPRMGTQPHCYTYTHHRPHSPRDGWRSRKMHSSPDGRVPFQTA
jgi:osomolarity two-component system sensor histidine kinase NIK1